LLKELIKKIIGCHIANPQASKAPFKKIMLTDGNVEN